MRYIGKGAWLPGVPARNLSQEEVILHGGVGVLVGSGLYVEAVDSGQLTVVSKKSDRAKRQNKVFHPAENKAGKDE